MIPELDYSRWLKNGQNIYFFKDTNHLSEEIQTRIFRKIEQLACSGTLSALFVEGIIEKIFPLKFTLGKIPEDLERRLAVGKDRWSLTRLLAYRCRVPIDAGQFSIYGAEDRSLFREHTELRSTIRELGSRLLENDLSVEEERELIRLIDEEEPRLIDARSRCAVDLVIEQVKRSPLGSVGLLFGRGHYQKMSDDLRKQGIGHCSYLVE